MTRSAIRCNDSVMASINSMFMPRASALCARCQRVAHASATMRYLWRYFIIVRDIARLCMFILPARLREARDAHARVCYVASFSRCCRWCQMLFDMRLLLLMPKMPWYFAADTIVSICYLFCFATISLMFHACRYDVVCRCLLMPYVYWYYLLHIPAFISDICYACHATCCRLLLCLRCLRFYAPFPMPRLLFLLPPIAVAADYWYWRIADMLFSLFRVWCLWCCRHAIMFFYDAIYATRVYDGALCA